ncbi:MAG: tyrosine--tRNA ligase [Phycisphaerales bacterium]|nr:tyrosine--tRNA ligase [Phycisphaerales bacterium]
MSKRIDLINELEWRGLLKDCTDKEGLSKHLADPDKSPRKIYAGFDPTADSLTIGNLVPIMLLAHVKRAGHVPVVVMGGGTGLIGDPSGKSAERMMMTEEIVQGNVDAQKPIYDAILNKMDGADYIPLNNNDWLSKISYIEALRDIGKHFSVNMMMQKESVKERLNNREQGISYTEFSYMILQAYDFAHLYEHEGVTVQLGGSDQYGNIVAGSDLIRRKLAAQAGADAHISGTEFDTEALKIAKDIGTDSIKTSFGLTAPLVSKADGGKFGKTETGAVWLTANRTSPYAYYQFWLNATDQDAEGWIKVFTFLDQDAIESLIARHQDNPGKRELQRTLAQEATKILHGQQAMENAEAAGKALFSGDIGLLDEQTMLEVFASVPTTEYAKVDLAGGVDMVEMLKSTKLASSNREAREFLSEGSVSINGEKIGKDTQLTESHLLYGSFIAIRRGKKKWHMTKWS